jgi:hypothetical protein
MQNKSIRQLMDHLDNLDHGRVLIRTPKRSFFSTRLNFEETWINESDGEVGQDLVSMGVSKQDRLNQAFVDKKLGAGKYQAGSAESNLALQALMKKGGSTTTPTAPSTTPTTTTPASTTADTVTKYNMDGDPDYKQKRGGKADPLGNSPQDYTDVLVPLITCKLSLKNGGKFSNEILAYVNHDDAQGDTKTVKVNSWEFKGSTIAMVERTMGDEWWDMSTVATDSSAEYVKLGLDIMNDQYKNLGWKYTGGNQKRVSTSLGTAMATYVNMIGKAAPNSPHIMVRAAICVGIQIGDKKTLHSPDMFFVGPMADWQLGGEDAFMSMLGGLQLAQGATLLKR